MKILKNIFADVKILQIIKRSSQKLQNELGQQIRSNANTNLSLVDSYKMLKIEI